MNTYFLNWWQCPEYQHWRGDNISKVLCCEKFVHPMQLNIISLNIWFKMQPIAYSQLRNFSNELPILIYKCQYSKHLLIDGLIKLARIVVPGMNVCWKWQNVKILKSQFWQIISFQVCILCSDPSLALQQVKVWNKNNEQIIFLSNSNPSP